MCYKTIFHVIYCNKFVYIVNNYHILFVINGLLFESILYLFKLCNRVTICTDYYALLSNIISNYV